MRKHTANDSNKIIELNTTDNREWIFSHKAKTEYPNMRHIVAEVNNAVQTKDTSLLILFLYGFVKELEDERRDKKEESPKKEIKKQNGRKRVAGENVIQCNFVKKSVKHG